MVAIEDTGVSPETWVHRLSRLQKRFRLAGQIHKEELRALASRIAVHTPERGDIVNSDALMDFVTFTGVPGSNHHAPST